jgi:hypothetical protein
VFALGLAGRAIQPVHNQFINGQRNAPLRADWQEAAVKARYLFNLFVASPLAQDPRRQQLIAAVLSDFDRLSGKAT